MTRCPSIDVWEARAGGREADLPAELSAHLRSCAPCRCTFEELRRNQAFLADVVRAVHRSGGVQRLRTRGAAAAAPHAAGSTNALSATSAPSLPGYGVVRQVACTNLSVVYEAVQESTGQRVAAKVLVGSPAADPGMRSRFEREVELLVTLRHPNIVPIFDAGLTGHHYYLIMPFIAGRPPDVYVEQAASHLTARLRLMRDICGAVDFAHQHGVLHRDLKPSNILVDERGAPHILDFGLGKILHGEGGGFDPGVTLHSGQLLGTPAYMSPEQTSGRAQDLDPRSDVYALGVILYRMLTGTMPYPTDAGLAETLHHIRETEPAFPRTARGNIDGEVEAIVLKALRKEKEHRYATAAELAEDIERYLRGEPVRARHGGWGYRWRKRTRRHREAVATAAVAVLLTAVGLAFLVTRDSGTGVRRNHYRFPVMLGGEIQDMDWVRLARETVSGRTRPSAREGHCMAYDAERRRMVLFGGGDYSYRMSDTWLWDGRTWTRAATDGPQRRNLAAMTFDAARKQIVLFGGYTPDRLDDTWIWDGNRWRELHPRNRPPARSDHAMTYDPARKRIVLFGGTVNPNQPDNQTWEWDGAEWVLVEPSASPPARAHASMAFDDTRGRVILVGGNTGSALLNDEWEWDGLNWVQAPTGSLVERDMHGLVFDQRLRRLILYGGRRDGEPLAGTWERETPGWTSIADYGPVARWGHAMVYDSDRRVTVLFGGHSREETSTETWELRPAVACADLVKIDAVCEAGVLHVVVVLADATHDGQFVRMQESGTDETFDIPIVDNTGTYDIPHRQGKRKLALSDPGECGFELTGTECP